MTLVDSHTHFFSRTFFEVMAGNSPREVKLPDLLGEIGIDLPSTDPEEHARRWLEEMDAHGVGHMATFASVPQEMHDVSLACRVAAGRLTGFAMIPANHEKALELVDRAIDLGFRGLLLFPVMHGYGIGSDEVAPVIARAAEAGLALIVHCGLLQIKLWSLLDIPIPFDLRHGNPVDLVVVANRHPEMPIIIPHFGCGFFRETLMAGAMCSNIFVDTSSSNSWTAVQETPMELREIFARTLDVYGPGRVLFGTDSCIWPRGWRSGLRDEQVAALDDLGVTGDDRAAILGGNALGLFRVAGGHAGSA